MKMNFNVITIPTLYIFLQLLSSSTQDSSLGWKIFCEMAKKYNKPDYIYLYAKEALGEIPNGTDFIDNVCDVVDKQFSLYGVLANPQILDSSPSEQNSLESKPKRHQNRTTNESNESNEVINYLNNTSNSEESNEVLNRSNNKNNTSKDNKELNSSNNSSENEDKKVENMNDKNTKTKPKNKFLKKNQESDSEENSEEDIVDKIVRLPRIRRV